MDEEGRAVFVNVCGRVERVPVSVMTLEALCISVAQRFDIGERIRFVSDEEDEPEVVTDEHLKRLAQQRHTLRVVITDSALSDLEQRMWQLRQLQVGFFQDEILRLKTAHNQVRNEFTQLRQVAEASARREVELAQELMNERRMREKGEIAATERHEALFSELRREQRARDAMEAALRKDLEDARQTAMKNASVSERQITEVKGALSEESQNRGASMEALLGEWAGSQAEIRHAIEGLRSDLERAMQDAEAQAKGLLREASAREAFEQFFGEKIRSVEQHMGKLESSNSDLESRVLSAMQVRTAHRPSQEEEQIVTAVEPASHSRGWQDSRGGNRSRQASASPVRLSPGSGVSTSTMAPNSWPSVIVTPSSQPGSLSLPLGISQGSISLPVATMPAGLASPPITSGSLSLPPGTPPASGVPLSSGTFPRGAVIRSSTPPRSPTPPPSMGAPSPQQRPVRTFSSSGPVSPVGANRVLEVQQTMQPKVSYQSFTPARRG